MSFVVVWHMCSKYFEHLVYFIKHINYIFSRPSSMLNIIQVEMCVQLLGDIMDLLYLAETGSTFRDITEIMLTVMRTTIQATISIDRRGPLTVSDL